MCDACVDERREKEPKLWGKRARLLKECMSVVVLTCWGRVGVVGVIIRTGPLRQATRKAKKIPTFLPLIFFLSLVPNYVMFVIVGPFYVKPRCIS